jgi:hypothetical protein
MEEMKQKIVKLAITWIFNCFRGVVVEIQLNTAKDSIEVKEYENGTCQSHQNVKKDPGKAVLVP